MGNDVPVLLPGCPADVALHDYLLCRLAGVGGSDDVPKLLRCHYQVAVLLLIFVLAVGKARMEMEVKMETAAMRQWIEQVARWLGFVAAVCAVLCRPWLAELVQVCVRHPVLAGFAAV